MTRIALLALALLVLGGCGTEEPAPSASAEEPEPEATPEPEPEPEPPAEIPSCPEDSWGVAANGPTRATQSGVEAAGWVRGMGTTWSTLRVCKTVDGAETRLSCAPVQRGGECELAVGDERCTATLPQPLLPAVVGQLIDTGERPSEGTWSCSGR